MKMLTIAVLGGAAALGLLGVAGLQTPAVDPVVSGSIPARGACLDERGGAISSRSARFSAGPDCEGVWPGLSGARTWTNNGDGTVVVANAQGEAILTVVDGDGLAYEAVEPADAMVTLISAD